jgi:hypothetical protein
MLANPQGMSGYGNQKQIELSSRVFFLPFPTSRAPEPEWLPPNQDFP